MQSPVQVNPRDFLIALNALAVHLVTYVYMSMVPQASGSECSPPVFLNSPKPYSALSYQPTYLSSARLPLERKL